MQVSYMRLRLDSWYQDLSYRERVRRMYGAQVTPQQVKHFTSDAESDPQRLSQAISRYGINEFIFVLRPATYIVPDRAHRSFPSLTERASA